MTLKSYKAKRDFKKTPEPRGKVTKISKSSKNLFIVQKHAASHLHYDFRLELNGVLLSWAIPKGPCLDSSIKRLAMHVEDHPVEYGGFEGVIPKGEYGGGTVMLWDKGRWESDDKDPKASYLKGKLTFNLHAKKLNGRWKLFRIKKDDKTWLLVKAKDKYEKPLKQYDVTLEEPDSILSSKTIKEIANSSNKKTWESKKPSFAKKETKKISNRLKIPPEGKLAAMPAKIAPQLAILVTTPPVGEDWIHEIKFDGYRFIAVKHKDNVKLLTRNGHNWTSKFEDVSNAILGISSKNFIIDGEMVVLDTDGKSDFQLLQNTLKNGGAAFHYFIFDIIYFDKFDISSAPLIERKNFLLNLLKTNKSPLLQYSDHIYSDGKAMFHHSCELGLEGIISKNAQSAYIQKRSSNWLKSKCIKRQEFVIGGIVAPRAGKRKLIRSLMVGVQGPKNKLIYYGNVGTGFTEASIKEIYRLLKKNETRVMPFSDLPPNSKDATWIKPNIVCEVEYTELTKDNILRHPSFKGIRLDKKPSKIELEHEISTPLVIKTSSSFPPLKTKISNPDKVFYPEGNITKREVAEYYQTVSEWILPYITKRPLCLLRCPEGYQKCFYQKHINESSKTLFGITINDHKKEEDYLYIKNEAGLMALPQMGVLEIHPWGSHTENVENPDVIVFDLDPDANVNWEEVVNTAFEMRKELKKLGLKSFVKTTGGKGLHIVIPIRPDHRWDDVKLYTKTFVEYMVMKHPDRYVSQMSKAKRKNKIFIDYLRNQRGATAVAPYSLRARANAPIAVPLHWDELSPNYKDNFYTIKSIQDRLANVKDPWKSFFSKKQSIKFD